MLSDRRFVPYQAVQLVCGISGTETCPEVASCISSLNAEDRGTVMRLVLGLLQLAHLKHTVVQRLNTRTKCIGNLRTMAH